MSLSIAKLNTDYLNNLPQIALKHVANTSGTTYNPITGKYNDVEVITNFTGNMSNFSAGTLKGINATRVDDNYLTESAKRIITTQDMAMDDKVRIGTDDYKIVYKKIASGYIVYGVMIWGS